MMTRFRTYCRWVVPALLVAGPVAAQRVLPTLPLTADPGRAAHAPAASAQGTLQRGTALALPFFEDFTSPLEGAPNAVRWLAKGGALVNNRFALTPLTRGTATLDGLKANGLPYASYFAGGSFPNARLDSLVSQPIDLSGLNASSRVVLSFAWQAGTIVRAPYRNSTSAPAKLELLVKTNTNVWESLWSAPSTGLRTGFRQQAVALDQAKYLHGDFQFMLVATGNTIENTDAWSVDYILLNRNRGLTDTTHIDGAIGAGLAGRNPTGGLNSPLRRFASMPVWQYNAASPPSSELTSALGVNLTNLNAPLGLSVDVLGTVQELPTGGPLGTWLQVSVPPIPTNTRRDPRTGAASSVALPTSAAPKRLRYTLSINSREPVGAPTLANDTIYRDVELNNYYAYDDGTAESATYLTAAASGAQYAFAYRFDLNQPDYVRGLRLLPVYPSTILGTPSAPAPVVEFGARTLTISVWDDNAGRPAANARVSKTVTIPAVSPTTAGGQFYQLDFDQPVRVTGTFYVGFAQPSTGRIVPYGVDYNSTFPAQHLLVREAGIWDTTNFVPSGTFPRGALMMRPVMTNNVATATASAQESAAYGLYPNPAHGTVTVTGPAFVRAAVLDALGRNVWEQPAAQAGKPDLSLPTLPAGVYTVRLTLANGRVVSRRLLLE
jgi:hypothetical protein